MNTEKLELFTDTFCIQMTINYLNNPDEYKLGGNSIPIVQERMREAIRKGTFNKDSKSFKQTCKLLGIKHTYKAINEYLER